MWPLVTSSVIKYLSLGDSITGRLFGQLRKLSTKAANLPSMIANAAARKEYSFTFITEGAEETSAALTILPGSEPD